MIARLPELLLIARLTLTLYLLYIVIRAAETMIISAAKLLPEDLPVRQYVTGRVREGSARMRTMKRRECIAATVRRRRHATR